MDGGERCDADLAKLSTQSDELKLEIMTFLKGKYADFDVWLDKTSVLHRRYEQLNTILNSTSQLVNSEVSGCHVRLYVKQLFTRLRIIMLVAVIFV